ncbi:hypothetical protein P8452_38630 [Trifolium repens]|nr:hypothetical protein P8452_38630 [Trifolium repens]
MATYDEKIREFLQEHTEYSCYDDIPLIIRRGIWMQVSSYNISPEAHAEIQRLTQELKAHKEELNRRAQQEQHMQDRLDRLDREAEERRAMMNEQFRRQMDEQRRQMDEYFRQMASSKNAPNDQTNSTDDEASDESDSEDADD